ncbi:ribosome maturation factor RimM [Micropruina sp.]|uniref:ribosome maturation factor RimM n=1 Tax=Micropruina sp. TaxID=2737536 RepID=UPI0039E5EEE5
MATLVDVIVGTVGRAHGLRGEVTVRVHTDYAGERFAPGAVLRCGSADGATLEVVASRRQGEYLLVAFRGFADRSRAETLRGTELWASVEAEQTDTDEFHDAALVGLEVRRGGAVMGRIVSITHNPAQDLLVVDTAGGERLVPFVTALVPVVDVPGGFVEVADLAGLFEPVGEDV